MRSPSAKRRLALAVVATAGTCVAPVFADEGLPGFLKDNYSDPCDKDATCLACHGSTAGGFNNFRYLPNGKDGFGATLRRVYKLDPTNAETWGPALEANKAAHSNIDGDDMSDLDEIAVGRDPNNPDPKGLLCGEGVETGPEYGCGGSHVAKSQSIDGVATAFAAFGFVAGAAWLRRRRERQS